MRAYPFVLSAIVLFASPLRADVDVFAKPKDLLLANCDSFVAAGDVTGDGKADILGVMHGKSSYGIAVSKGDGTFEPCRDTGIASSRTAIVVLRDIDGDGAADIIRS